MTTDPFAPETTPATERQIAFVKALATERDTSSLAANWQARIAAINTSIHLHDADPQATVGGLDKPLTATGASALINTLMPLPRRADAPNPNSPEAREDLSGVHPEVIAGRYALDAVQGGHTVFYVVDRPTEGKWAGRVFVKVQSSDDERNIARSQIAAVLGRIAEAGVRESAIRYGHEIGRCALCGRTLTNEASRERGIGPKCAETAGW